MSAGEVILVIVILAPAVIGLAIITDRLMRF